MPLKYYNLEETAKALGVDEDEVKRLQQDRKLYGYRDGPDWKFKVEDVEKIRAARAGDSPQEGPEDEGDVLLSEVELGESDLGASGTVIGMEGGEKAAADSDIQLADSDVKLTDSDVKLGEGSETADAAATSDVDSKVSQFEELDLTLEEDLTLEDSQIAEGAETPAGDSTVDLTGKQLEDDDLVLGGSGAGSDVTIGGDSGISLVDPADSGLSLEEPLDLTASGTESLELGEDDMISLGEDADTEAPTELRTDDDFLLTPLEEVGEDEESESGSQVIALDAEGDESETMVAGGAMAAMLDEDLGAEPAIDLGDSPQLGALGEPGVAGLPSTSPALPERPYSIWNVLGLALCVIVLAFSGMFMYDLMRNMWSWNAPYEVNSSMMDTILGWIEK